MNLSYGLFFVSIVSLINITYVWGYNEMESLNRLQDCGFRPINILDIGAKNGDWSKTLHNIYLDSKVLMIEANNDCQEHLSRDDLTSWSEYEISEVSNKQYTYTNKEIYIKCNITTTKPIFPESVLTDNISYVKESTKTVDEIARNHKLSPIQLIKIDNPGLELSTLESAKNTLESVEVLLIKYDNIESPSFFHIYEFLYHQGFEIYDIPTIIRNQQNSDFPLQYDVLFIKENSALWEENCTKIPNHMNKLQRSNEGLFNYSQYALVTLITGKDEGYIKGAITLAQSLIEVKSQLKRYVMITPDVLESSRAVLLKFYELIEVKPIICRHVLFGHKQLTEAEYDILGENFKLEIKRFSTTCTKFHVFKLIQFTKILFMDADTIVLHPIDHIFNISNSQVLSAAPSHFPPGNQNFNILVVD